ncbi:MULTISPECIES: hypothetical protein [unclassified Fusibacter]|uniref:hypothetical protein n=1 Tax=unclassified Fusibacter TaxID=2624464 RepID=UPI001010DB11|nr:MULTISPECIES: hypothetical protein [unclassified Fusibacter]MCK8059719.1 hypothetical protein [Fusibacter sp. A2]NPE21520.1 hypothetical protein [Fusibacter sp. A1]RXV61930.1 hypothetical protein DWB64_06735 [Fusibacter sp. A1]
MENSDFVTPLSNNEKQKVAYALNLCAVSIAQIIDSKDIIVLKQEREAILSNLNLQNYVKHPALLDVLKQILDTITYLEIQAGDMSFIEKEYQHKLKNAIWSAVPSPGVLFAGGDPLTLVIAVSAQIGTGYMNYRRNKSEYLLDKERSEWELKRHELEQLYGLRSQLFETAWKLSLDYNFDDKYRLTQKQLSRFSEALLEPDHIKRYERLDVMSDKFHAFPPFWYYKGNAAMEVYRSEISSVISYDYKEHAINSYNNFHTGNFEFLREDIIAASCCIEHISLLAPNDVLVPQLLERALRYAGENYDLLQQSIFVNLSLGNLDDVILPLREMIANDYNVGLNAILLSRIYFAQTKKNEYEKLALIAGVDNVLPWSNNTDESEKLLVDKRKLELSDEYLAMARLISQRLKTKKKTSDNKQMYEEFKEISKHVLKYSGNHNEVQKLFDLAERKLNIAIVNSDDDQIDVFFESTKEVSKEILKVDFHLRISEEMPKIIDKMNHIVKL